MPRHAPIPTRLEDVILECLEKDPERRYESMRKLSEALRLAASAGGGAEKTRAVLYFENVGGEKEDGFFCDGIPEDIIIELSKIKNLTVLPRSTVLASHNQSIAATDVGRKLGAMYVLEGSVRRAGNRLRITTQLVETRTARSLWAERFGSSS